MRSPNLTTLRKNSLTPTLALLVSVVMVAGQLFTCCRLNESVSETVERTAKWVGAWVTHSGQPGEPWETPAARTHGDCHGHSPGMASSSAASVPDPAEPAESELNRHDACLSEAGYAPTALQPASGSLSLVFLAATASFREPAASGLSGIEKPRPQNKSSPPVYLLTLRILV